MPTHDLRFYDADPFLIFSQTIGGTATWTGPSDAVGKATVTDNEAGVEGLTLDDDGAGGETATADVDLNGVTSTGSSVDAEEVWTLRDTVTGDVFEVVSFQVDTGAAAGYYTVSEIPLVAGRSYETIAFNGDADAASGDIALTFDDFVAPDHIVTGTRGNDNIDGAYAGDPQNDQVDDGFAGGTDGNDNTIEARGGDDTVDAGLGDDTVDGGAGHDSILGGQGDDSLFGGRGRGRDTIEGGSGSDTIAGGGGGDNLDGGEGDDSIDGDAGHDAIFGGLGNDTIDGGNGDDTIEGDGGSSGTTEFLDWGAVGPDGTSIAAGFTQTTGEMEVSVSFTDDGNNNPTFLVESTDTQYVEAGEDFDPNSALYLYGDGDGATSTTTIDFAAGAGSSASDEVESVSFRINDVDTFAGNHQDVLHVYAYDEAGNPVAVTLTAEGDDSTSGNTITAGAALDNPQDANGSVLVEIAGPVAQIVIVYENADSGTQAVSVTEVYFETISAPVGTNDVIDGGIGDDVIDGGTGEDTITGGTGADTMTGGDGDDVFVLADGSGSDVVTDFDTGDDDGNGSYNDQIDVSSLTDAGGNPVDAGDVVVTDDGSGNALLSFPNGETLLLLGVAPAEVTGAQLLKAAGIPCFTEGTLIRTERGDVPVEELKAGDRIMTRDSGAQPITWIGSRRLGKVDLAVNPDLKPVIIPEGVCGNYAPLCVSPLHGVMLDTQQWSGEEVLVRAKHLAEAPGPVRIANGKKRVTYIHLMFESHQILFANGAPTESFYPGPCALQMFPEPVVEELQNLLPGLGEKPVEEVYGPPARRFLKRREALNDIDLRRSKHAVQKSADLRLVA